VASNDDPNVFISHVTSLVCLHVCPLFRMCRWWSSRRPWTWPDKCKYTVRAHSTRLACPQAPPTL